MVYYNTYDSLLTYCTYKIVPLLKQIRSLHLDVFSTVTNSEFSIYPQWSPPLPPNRLYISFYYLHPYIPTKLRTSYLSSTTFFTPVKCYPECMIRFFKPKIRHYYFLIPVIIILPILVPTLNEPKFRVILETHSLKKETEPKDCILTLTVDEVTQHLHSLGNRLFFLTRSRCHPGVNPNQ